MGNMSRIPEERGSKNSEFTMKNSELWCRRLKSEGGVFYHEVDDGNV